jgi:hypothetical protein
MKRKKILIVAAICIGVLIVGLVVGYFAIRGENIVQVKNNDENERKLKNSVLKAISADRLYDFRSIEWYSEDMDIVYDELDNRFLLDGRAGMYRSERFKTAMGIELTYNSTAYTSSLFTDLSNNDGVNNSEEFKSVAFFRTIHLKRHDRESFETLAQAYSNDMGLLELEISELKSGGSYRLYTGIIDKKIGFILLGYGSDGSVYSLVYCGNGNYTDIKNEAYKIK